MRPRSRRRPQAAGIDLYVHAPYPINVASTNNRIRIPGRKLLQQHLLAAAEIGAKGVIVHGGHLGKDEDSGVGFDNWRKCVDGLEMPVPLLIENTAGGDNAMARRLEAIERLWEAIGRAEGGDTVGFCLDTCHAHAGGNDLGSVVEKVRAVTGRIDLVHCNDSRDEFDTGADRHTNLGSGHIDGADLADVVRGCRCAGGRRDARWRRGPVGRHRLAARAARAATEPGRTSSGRVGTTAVRRPGDGLRAALGRARTPVADVEQGRDGHPEPVPPAQATGLPEDDVDQGRERQEDQAEQRPDERAERGIDPARAGRSR